MIKTLRIEISGEEFIEGWDVAFEFVPGEKRVMYDSDGSGYPGSPARHEPIEATLQWRESMSGERVSFEPMTLTPEEFCARGRDRFDVKDLQNDAAESFAEAQQAAYDDYVDHKIEEAWERRHSL